MLKSISIINKLYILVTLLPLSTFASNIDINGSIASDINATGAVTITTIIGDSPQSTQTELRIKLNHYFRPRFYTSISTEIEFNNMFFLEGGLGYEYDNPNNRNYQILSEYDKGEIPDDRLLSFLTAGVRYYAKNSPFFVEALGGVSIRKETYSTQPYFSSSTGWYSYEGDVKNIEFSIGAMYHDVGHSSVDFNDFGNASFEENQMEWNLIVAIKWFWKSDTTRTKK